MDEKQYSLLKHIRELRICVVRSLFGIIFCSFISMFFSKEILIFLRKPMKSTFGALSKYIAITPQEYFFTQIKTGIIFGLLLSSPWILFQIWLFVAPGLYRNEKKYSTIFVLAGAFFFIFGAIFSYEFVFPYIFNFFINTLPSDIEGCYSIGLLFDFAISMLLAFGVIFETPVFVFMLIFLNIVDIKTLKKIRRYIVILAFIIGALLTPPDPITQIFLALPLIILYELGLLFARIIPHK